MPRKSAKELNKIHGGFVPITYEMINSTSFKELSGSALKALILCMRKVKTNHHIDRFKFHFSLTYPEAKKQGLCHTSFCRGMKLLGKVGFIDVVIRGGMRCLGKKCSYYRLSQRWKKYGTPEFQEKWDGYCAEIHDEDVF
jgi:hypothetical protein